MSKRVFCVGICALSLRDVRLVAGWHARGLILFVPYILGGLGVERMI